MSHTELNRKLAVLVEKNVIHKSLDDQTISYSLMEFGKDLVHIFYHLEDLEERYFYYSQSGSLLFFTNLVLSLLKMKELKKAVENSTATVILLICNLKTISLF